MATFELDTHVEETEGGRSSSDYLEVHVHPWLPDRRPCLLHFPMYQWL